MISVGSANSFSKRCWKGGLTARIFRSDGRLFTLINLCKRLIRFKHRKSLHSRHLLFSLITVVMYSSNRRRVNPAFARAFSRPIRGQCFLCDLCVSVVNASVIRGKTVSDIGRKSLRSHCRWVRLLKNRAKTRLGHWDTGTDQKRIGTLGQTVRGFDTLQGS